MVSLCCGDCMNKQLKMNALNKIFFEEQSNYIMSFLDCDEKNKILDIIDDPIYKSIHPEEQPLFLLVKLFPFPETIKDFKNMTKQYKLPPYFSKNDFREVKSLVNRKTFPMIKYYYNNMYKEMPYKNNFIRNGCSKIIQNEMTKKGLVGWCSWKILMWNIKIILGYYINSNKSFHFKRLCNIETDDDFKEFCFWKIQQKSTF